MALHSELHRGDLARLERLRRTAPAASSASRREQARQRSPQSPGMMCICQAKYIRLALLCLVPNREAQALLRSPNTCLHAMSAALAAHARAHYVQSSSALLHDSSVFASTRCGLLFR